MPRPREVGNPAPPPDPRQPCHIADLVQRLHDRGQPEAQFRRALNLTEVSLKTVTAVLYAVVSDAASTKAASVRSGLGTAGTWVAGLNELVADPLTRGRRAFTDALIDWLSAESLSWVSDSMDTMNTVLSVLQGPATLPRRPTVCDVLGATVRARNLHAHGGDISVSSLRVAAQGCRVVALRLVAEWPCRTWTWAIASNRAWWSAQSQTASRIARDPDFSPPSHNGLYVWAGTELPLHCPDLLLPDPDPPRIFCLNSPPSGRGGRVDYLNYATNEHRRERLEAVPTPNHDWLRESAPAPMVRLVGRDSVIAGVRRLVARARVVSLVGQAGMGKTVVASALAASSETEYAGHLLWCDCNRWPPGADRLERDVFAVIRRRITDHPTLLVLDSLEVALDTDAKGYVTGAIQSLCEDRPELRILTTTLFPLNISGEVQYPIQPLDTVPPGDHVPLEDLTNYSAMQLLVDRIRDVKPSYRVVGADAGALCTIATTLGGHPLALELVGPLVGWRGATTVAAELVSTVSLPERVQGPARHRSVAAAVTYSLSSLSETDRTVLIMICSFGFVGSWSLLQAMAVQCGLEPLHLEHSLQNLEQRRLTSRVQHAALAPHALIRRQLQDDESNRGAIARVQFAAVAVVAGWYDAENPAPRPCVCPLCTGLDQLTAESYVVYPGQLQAPAPLDLLRLALAWTRGGVEDKSIDPSIQSGDEPDGVSLLDAAIAAASASDLPEALPLKMQAVEWLIHEWPAPEGLVARACHVADALYGRGDVARALELLSECAEGEYESFGDFEPVENVEVFAHGPEVFVRLMRWARAPETLGIRASACLRYLRWLLYRAGSKTTLDRRGLRKARQVSRRAQTWAAKAGDQLGMVEAAVSEAIINYLLDPRETTGVDVILRLSQVMTATSRAGGVDRTGRARGDLVLRVVTASGGEWNQLAEACLDDADKATSQSRWMDAARWIGYAELWGVSDSTPAASPNRLSLVRDRVDEQLGRGATTLAIAEARSEQRVTILREMGYSLPGEPGYVF